LSVGLHAIRCSAITNYLNSDVLEPVVGDRANVRKDVLALYHGHRIERKRMGQPRR
jgi:hypothetical protein